MLCDKHQILRANIIRNVLQTVSRINILILRGKVNPWMLKSDSHLVSPYIIIAELHIKVTIKELIHI